MSLFGDLLNALNTAQVGGSTVCITPTITTTAVAYTSGDCIGGVLKLDAAVRVKNGTSVLKSVVVRDNLNQKANLTILIFNSNPTGATTTDNSAFAWGTSLPQCICSHNIASTDYETIDSKAIANVDTFASPVQPDGSNSLWAVILTTSTPTYGANATTLYVTFNFLRD